MKRYSKLLPPILFIIDLFIVMFSYLLAVLYNFHFEWPYKTEPSYLFLSVIIGGIWILCSIIFKTYIEAQGSSLKTGILKVFYASLVSIFLLTTYLFLIKNHEYSRLVILNNIFFTFILLSLWHIIRYSILLMYRKRGFNFLNVLLIGEGFTSKQIYEYVNNHPEHGLKIEEYINNYDITLDSENYEHDLIKSLSRRMKIDKIICTIPLPFSMDLEKLILETDNIGARMQIALEALLPIKKRYKLQMLDGITLINTRSEPLRSVFNLFLKRFYDVIFSLIIIVFIFPWVIPIIALVIMISTGENPFYIQRRVGISGKIFSCIKFRTLKKEENQLQKTVPENDKEYGITMKDDPRITPVGNFLRKSNLDELPQFFNVILNQMSIVGPRPHMVSEDKRINQLINRYKVRQYIRPGITGWAAINGYRGGTTNYDLMQKRIDYDIWYVENWSIWLDIKICFITVWNLVIGKNMGH